MKYLVLLALSQLSDLGSTAFSLAHGATEMNPVGRFVLEHGGYISLLGFKVAFVAFAAYIIYRARRFGVAHIRRVNRIVLVLAVLFILTSVLNMVSWM